MTPEQWALILGALGVGGVLKGIIDIVGQGQKESRQAKGLSRDDLERAEAEAAYWSEKVQETRELYLREGGDPEKLGPPPRFQDQKARSNRREPYGL